MVFWLFPAFAQDKCDYVVSGQVLDLDTRQPLPYATVAIANTDKGTYTDDKGFFRLENLCELEVNLIISSVGYKTTEHHHDSFHRNPVILMAEDDKMLESVVVEGEVDRTDLHTMSVNEVESADLMQSTLGNLGELARNINGVTMLTTGQNVAKPVIHGLHSNRVLIINNGVRHEFQNWGDEHAPEIDPSMAASLQVVKGAATVKYGPEAMGGVIIINPRQLDLDHTAQVQVGTSGSTNGKAYGSDLHIQNGWKRFAVGADAAYKRQGDLHAPDYQLTNTGKNEYSYSFSAKYHRDKLNVESYYSHFFQNLGILRGSVSGSLSDLYYAMEADTPANTTAFSYEINNPRQEVTHDLYKFKASYNLPDQDFVLQYSWQKNHRQEYDVRRGINNSLPSINLILNTHALDFEWNHPDFGRFTGNAGIQLGIQNNANIYGTNTIQYVPNYNNTRSGIYWIERYKKGENTFEAGVRYDYLYMSVKGYDSQNKLYGNDLSYGQFTGSLGIRRNLTKELTLYSNIGMAWRPPNVSELYSFGKHGSSVEYGLWRYQIVNSDSVVVKVLNQDSKPVHAEVGYKWINSLEWNTAAVQIDLTAYANYIQNYIYDRPAGVTSTVRGVFPYFIFDQADAFIAGIDLAVVRQLRSDLELKMTGSVLTSQVLAYDYELVGMPPMRITVDLSYKPEISWLKENTFMLKPAYTFHKRETPRVISAEDLESGADINLTSDNFDFMSAPAGYFLMGASWTAQKGRWSWALSVSNALNKSYRSYTDRLRYFADETGRSFMLNLNYSIK